MSNAFPSPSRVMSAAEVAAALGVTEGHFRTIRRGLEAAGFPQKLPARAAWSRAAVERWIDTDAGRAA